MILLWAAVRLLEPFALGDGDRIVVVGDSITVEGHAVRILENFVRTRFPRWNIVVRNAGINGQTARGGSRSSRATSSSGSRRSSS